MELQEKEGKDGKHIGKLFRKTQREKISVDCRLVTI